MTKEVVDAIANGIIDILIVLGIIGVFGGYNFIVALVAAWRWKGGGK